jgi:hypothetical protein
MHLQATLSRDDLEELFYGLLPLTIRAGVPDQTIAFYEPRGLTLVANDGLRLVCKAKITWPVLGLKVPILVHEVVVRIRPEIAARAQGAALVFHLSLEHADFALLPDAVDRTITDRINVELTKDPVDLSWAFARTLSLTVPLPDAIEPSTGLSLGVVSSTLRITDKALEMLIGLYAKVGVSKERSQ